MTSYLLLVVVAILVVSVFDRDMRHAFRLVGSSLSQSFDELVSITQTVLWPRKGGR